VKQGKGYITEPGPAGKTQSQKEANEAPRAGTANTSNPNALAVHRTGGDTRKGASNCCLQFVRWPQG